MNQEDPQGNLDLPIVERKSRIALMKKEKLVKRSVITSRFPCITRGAANSIITRDTLHACVFAFITDENKVTFFDFFN